MDLRPMLAVEVGWQIILIGGRRGAAIGWGVATPVLFYVGLWVAVVASFLVLIAIPVALALLIFGVGGSLLGGAVSHAAERHEFREDVKDAVQRALPDGWKVD